ncbi:LytTR family transcriptional regulator DNA-binding domain-containing protein [Aminicella lysinilytica]|jgi:DNA-binding LytR/AlgR family response regulator|uniref:LytTr DNA-binding domain-containing protein n=1 Tax=Aminicella lysinilytica TaxID=433323 RepID=A0A4R6Q1F7_9FIRM|nr:LytTR family transcriptional regulator DNA-binding domain-containing protein [Aminicella lysinilytica]NLD10882.1 LytTR family transcriptional regulator [Clostridiales bacterium]TDP54600.1 LytTr DNA-binding domain-containing protein [Aminicella lysinilytica]
MKCVKYIPIITRDKSTRVRVSDVQAIERDHRKLKVITAEEEYEIYGKIEEVTDYLDSRFYTCMAGCIINLDQVESMEERKIEFFGGNNMVMGRENFAKTRQVYNEHIRNGS